MNSLAYGHHRIPTRVEDVVDEAPDGEVLSAEAARAGGIIFPNRQPPAEPTLTVPNRPRCVWQQRREKHVTDARQIVRDQLGFADDDEEDEPATLADDDGEEDDDDEGPARTSTHSNPFILDSCAVSRSRRLDSE